MPSSANLARALTARIVASAHDLTVVYPMARTPVDGTSPGPAPFNPFLGAPQPVPHIVADPGTPLAPPVTLKCLWQDALTNTGARAHQVVVEQLGWHADADAVARVLARDIVTAPGKTCLDTCDHVEHDGQHYVVLKVTPIGATFAAPTSYAVWLQTMQGQ